VTNKEVWTQYKEYSQNASEILRKIAFAGIAFCWLFRNQNNQFPNLVFLSLIFLIFFFIFDLFQYLFATLMLKIWIRKKEIEMWNNTGKIEGDYQLPTWLDLPAFILFLSKATTLLVTFVLLVIWFFFISAS
jgi:hypothetical protein